MSDIDKEGLRLSAPLGLVILIGSLLLFPSCSRLSGEQQAKAATTVATPAGVVKASREDLSKTLTMVAEFRPYQEIDIHAKVSGFVRQIFVDVGDRVKEGQLLATLEIPEFKDDLMQASADKKRYEQEIIRA